jgi:hypothetical protein
MGSNGDPPVMFLRINSVQCSVFSDQGPWRKSVLTTDH